MIQTKAKGESTHVRTKRSELSKVAVGELCLRKMSISKERFSMDDIAYIGLCSIRRKRIVVAHIGVKWHVLEATRHNIALARHHGYIIKGKKCIPLYQKHGATMQECIEQFNVGVGKPLCNMRPGEIFAMCKGERFHKKPQNGGSSLPYQRGLSGGATRREDAEANRVSTWSICITK